MLVADEVLGTLEDPDVAERVEARAALTVTLDGTERRRSRVRTTAEDGTDVGIVVGRELCDGDVLTADGRPVVVSLEPVEAMALDFSGVNGDPDAASTAALELGHAVGNRHWDLTVEGERAYVPVVEDRERMAREVGPLLPNGVTASYESVSPALFDGATPDHGSSGTDSRTGDHAHSHAHEHDAGDHEVQSRAPEGGDES